MKRHEPYIRPLRHDDLATVPMHVGSSHTTTQEGAAQLLQLGEWLGMLVRVKTDVGRRMVLHI